MKKEVQEKKGENQLQNSASNHRPEGDKKGKYEIQVDDKRLYFEIPVVTGKQILKEAGYKPVECWVLYQKFKGCDFERIGMDEKVDLSKPGLEKFTVKETDIFHYTVDDEPEISDKKIMTAKEILIAAGLNPKDYYLVELLPNNKQKSYKDNPDEKIELRCPGNKFVSVFNGETPVS